MAAPERVVILQSWSTRDEISIIKEVANKGEYVDLCMAYLARKKHCPIEESRRFFHQIVDNYVSRLINDKLILKAEDILCNVSRDWKSVFYQFAFDTKIHTLKFLILDHIRKKYPIKYDDEFSNYEFYWKILKDIQKYSILFNEIQNELETVNLESLYQKDDNYRKSLIVRLYFNNKDTELLNKVDKISLWNYLISNKLYTELIKWFYLSHKYKNNNEENIDNVSIIDLNNFYKKYNIEENMLINALNINTENIPEILKYYFAIYNNFFDDEKSNIQIILHRIFTTETINTNLSELCYSKDLYKFALEKNAYNILIDEIFYSENTLNDIILELPDKKEQIKFLINLNNESLCDYESFKNLLKSIESCLNSFNDNDYEIDDCSSIINLSKYILNEKTLDNIHSNDYISVKYFKYIQYLIQKLNNVNYYTTSYKFNVIENLKIFKNIDLNEINKECRRELITFSNKELSRKYSQNFKLNYINYLKQLRSSYAIYYFLICQLIDYSQISKSQLHNATEIITDLCIEHFINDDFIIHCIAFIEMIGFDTQNLRSFLQSLRICFLPSSSSQSSSSSSSSSSLNSNKFEKTKNVYNIPYHEVIINAEKKIFDKNNLNEFPLRQYNTLIKASHALHNKIWPNLYLNLLCENNDWWKYLILIQYFDIPLCQIQKNLKDTKLNKNDHMLRSLSYEPIQEKIKRRSSISRQKSKTKEDAFLHTSGETTTSSISSSSDVLFKSSNQMKFLQENDNDLDIFAIILLNTNNTLEDKISSYTKFIEIIFDTNSYSTSINLLKCSIKYIQPIYAVLSSVVNDLNIQYCWTIWLTVSTVGYKEISKYKDFDEIFWYLIETNVRMGYIETLHKSFQLFFKESKFNHFINFLERTYNLNFTENIIDELRTYLLACSNNEIYLPINKYNKDNLLYFSIKLLIIHLIYNFDSKNDQQNFIDIVCQSGISDLNLNNFDFCLFRKIFKIISSSEIEYDYEKLLIYEIKNDNDNNTYYYKNNYENLLIILQELKQYDKAIELCNILNIPIGNLIYSKWINDIENLWENYQFNFNEYEDEIIKHSLSPEILINLYLHIASLYDDKSIYKYSIMKKALDVIKKHHLFPNESFDRNQIEYEMTICYLQNEQNINDLDISYSEYYEQILSIERCVLYKSFPELKELAGIEDIQITSKIQLNGDMKIKLSNLLNRLLDNGDIVEALRLQAMFEYRTLDLHFIVFCMALAEGLTSLYNLSSDERQLLAAIEMKSITKFNKRTLGRVKPLQTNLSHSPESWSTLDFEEIPPREKQDVVDAIQGLASRLKHGINIGKRILMVYRAAMYLDKDYLDILRMKDSMVLLRSAVEDDCLQKILVVSDIMVSMQMTQVEIADFLSYEIVTGIIRPRFYMFCTEQSRQKLHMPIKNNLWGYDLDKEFHLFLELCPNTTLLGNYLLEYCDALKIYRKFQDNKNYDKDINKNPHILNIFENLKNIIQIYGFPSNQNQNQNHNTSQVLSYKKQNIIYVELLIKAHECFIHECSMEGIASILNRSKSLNLILGNAKSWNLIVRMLTGIHRYREMYFCFDTLIKNEQFESLLGQFNDDDKTDGLHHGIMWYIKEYYPQNKDYLELAALHFLMFKQLAELCEQETNSMIAKILSKYQKIEDIQISYNEYKLKTNTITSITSKTPITFTMISCSSNVLDQLNEILNMCIHTTENYLLDNKLRLAKRSASNAELIAIQIDLINKSTISGSQNCICILNIRSYDEFKELVNKELSVIQALILSRAYSYDINWSEAIFNQCILLGRNSYILEFTERMNLTDNLIENIVKNFQFLSNVKPEIEENMMNLVKMAQSVGFKYKLASILGFKGILTSLINDQSSFYLKDVNYGRSSIGLIEN